jgi:hypothetical protein
MKEKVHYFKALKNRKEFIGIAQASNEMIM